MTFLHANNFDQFLATSILPLMTALAFWVRWADVRGATTLGAAGAAVVQIYPELAPVMLTAPAIVLLYRWLDERPAIPALLTTVAVGLLAMAIGALPFLPTLPHFFAGQLTGALAVPPRPGEGYFPTFFTPQCAPGALFMLYEPFLPCGFGVKSVVTGAVGAVGLVLLAAGTIKARGRLIPLAWFSWLTIGLAVLMLIWKRYDYGAYKLLSAGYPFLAVLVANGAAARAWWSRGAGGLIAAVYTVLIGLRLVSLDGTAKFKTVEEFRGMLAYIPPSSIVVMKIKDNLAFEWAAYYLRDRRTVPLVGRLPYLPPKPLNDPTLQRLLPQAQFLVSDMQDDVCWGPPVWSSDAYRVFSIKEPRTDFDCRS